VAAVNLRRPPIRRDSLPPRNECLRCRDRDIGKPGAGEIRGAELLQKLAPGRGISEIGFAAARPRGIRCIQPAFFYISRSYHPIVRFLLSIAPRDSRLRKFLAQLLHGRDGD